MKTSKIALITLGLATVIGCSAGAEDPGTESSASEANTPSAASATSPSAAVAPVDTNAKPIEAVEKAPGLRAQRAEEQVASATSDDGVIAKPEIPTGPLETEGHTSCRAVTQTSYAASVPPPPPGWPVSNFMSVLAQGAFADDGSKVAVLKSWQLGTRAPDSTLTVRADVNFESGHVEVNSYAFGYANAGIKLNLDVKSGNTVVCSSELSIADSSSWAGDYYTPISGMRSISCTLDRARGASALTAEVKLTAYDGLGGAASAYAQANARLLQITSTDCEEPGVFSDGEGLCVKPTSPTFGSRLHIDACDTNPNNKFTFDPASGLIHHRTSGLCVSIGPGWAAVQDFLPISLQACSTTDPYLDGLLHWTLTADGHLAARQNPAFCLDAANGGGPGSELQIWNTITPPGKNQQWTFIP